MKSGQLLSFVEYGDDGEILNAWDVSPSCSYEKDCQLGAQYFFEVQKLAASTSNHLLIHSVLVSIALAGEVGGIEVGFFNAMASSLI